MPGNAHDEPENPVGSPPAEFLAAAPVGLAYFDEELRFLWINDLLAGLNDMAPAAHLGRQVREVYGELSPGIEAAIRGVFATGTPATGLGFTTPGAGAAGTPRNWQVSFFPVAGPDGTRRVGGVVVEVSPKDRTIWLLEGQLRVFAQMAVGAPLNDVLALLCTVIEDQAIGLRCSVLRVDETGKRLRLAAAPRLPEAYRRAAADIPIAPNVGSCGTAAFLDEPVLAADIATDPRWEKLRDVAAACEIGACWSTPIHSHSGNQVLGTFAMHFRHPRSPTTFELQIGGTAAYIAGLAIEQDLADRERDRLLTREHQARTEAEAASRAKDEFLATVSHELRTPLSPVLAWAGVLRSPAAPPTLLARGLETIERNARMQAQLIDDLLDVSRIVSGKLRIERRSLDLGLVTQAAVDVVRPAAEAKGVMLAIELPAGPARFDGDPDRLQQVVWNLVSNAVKFTPAGGRVTVDIVQTDGRFTITVQDTGEGIDPAFLPHVFERFRQADASVTRRHGGLGLGLAIARHLVELHGGQVEAASDGLGAGATFTVHLPAPAPAGET